MIKRASEKLKHLGWMNKVLGATKDHRSIYATSFVDVTTGALLDVVQGRSAECRCLLAQPKTSEVTAKSGHVL